jgi:putative membrane protein (TIGR04086 family)
LEERNFYVKVGNGVLRSTILTIILLVIFAIVMSVVDVGPQVMSVYYLVVTCISIVYGAIYSAKKNNRRGWLVGILVAVFYMMVLYIISGIFFQDFSINSKDFLRFTIAVLVGTLSGMLGINI